ncbi:MAG: hypothetical protein AB1779_06635 [Candidatus Thermoplasmatota archaeon]
METTQIENLSIDTTVKLYGKIESNYTFPINYYMEELPNGEIKKSMEIHNFTLNDTTGIIQFNLSYFHLVVHVVKYPHKNYTNNITHYWFENGDYISAIGKVRVDDSGNLTFFPNIIALTSTGYPTYTYTDYTDLLIFGMIGGAFLVGAILSFVSYIFLNKRIKIHTKNMGEQTAFFSRKISPPKTPLPDIHWYENPSFNKMYLAGKISAVITIILLILMFIFLLPGASFDIIKVFDIIMVCLIILIFPAIFAYVFLISNRSNVPTHIGFDKNGIHAKYKAKVPNPMLIQYVGWDDIKSVEHLLAPGYNRLIFYTLDGRELNLTTISEELFSMVMKEYEQRKERLTKEKGIEHYDYSSLSWEINEYRLKYLRRSIVLILIQIILVPISIWYLMNYGLNDCIIIFYLPGIIAILAVIFQFFMPSKIEITKDCVFIKKGREIFEHNFEKIKTISLYFRGVKFWYNNGLIKTIVFITPNTALRIFKAMEEYKAKNGVIINNFSGSSEIVWKRNKAYDYYHRLFVLPLYIIACCVAIIGFLTFFSIVELWLGILIIILLSLFLISPLPAWYPLKHAPIEVGFSMEGLHCKYANGESSKVLINWISWEDVVEIDSEPGLEDYAGETILRSGKDKKYFQIQKNTGIGYLLGPLDDNIFEELKIKFAKCPKSL